MILLVFLVRKCCKIANFIPFVNSYWDLDLLNQVLLYHEARSGSIELLPDQRIALRSADK